MRSSPIDRLCLLAAALALPFGPLAAETGRARQMAAPLAAPIDVQANAQDGTHFALLIGVMGYPNLRARDRLIGPGNDVALVADYLRSTGYAESDIRILLDDGIHPPATLDAIRQEMARLAAQAGPGDTVYLHFSGHGTQAPAPAGSDEADGLDELFLPYDVGHWNGRAAAVENALVDDEIGQMLDAIRARGAAVWAVFDSCNSGTVTRGPDEVRLRRVAPEALGIEIARGNTAAATGDAPFDASALGGAPGIGALTAFFAARANQSTPEMNLPLGAPDRRPQGLFTYTLLSELAAHPGRSYADLGAAILSRYAAEGLAPGTEPMFEGALSDAALTGGPAGAAAPQSWPMVWRNAAATIPAGMLHGLAVGDALRIVRADGTGDLGRLVLGRVTPFASVAALEPGAGIDRPGDLPAGARAQAIGATIPVTLTLAPPPFGSMSIEDFALFNLGLGQAAPELVSRLVMVDPGAVADLRLVVDDGQIALVPGAGVAGDGPLPGLPIAPDPRATGARLGAEMRLWARALLITRAAAAIAPRLSDVDAELGVIPEGQTAAAPLDPATVPELVPGDIVTLALRNGRAQPVDIDVLYIAADRTIQHLRQIRLAPGDAASEPLFRVLPEGYGREMLLVVQRETTLQSPADPLTFLATGATPEIQRTRSDFSAPSLAQFLAEAGFGSGTRGPSADAVGAAAIWLVPVITRHARATP